MQLLDTMHKAECHKSADTPVYVRHVQYMNNNAILQFQLLSLYVHTYIYINTRVHKVYIHMYVHTYVHTYVWYGPKLGHSIKTSL